LIGLLVFVQASVHNARLALQFGLRSNDVRVLGATLSSDLTTDKHVCL